MRNKLTTFIKELLRHFTVHDFNELASSYSFLQLIYRMSPLLTLAVGLFFCLPLLEFGAGARLSLSGTMKTPWNMTDKISNGSREEGSTSEHLDEAFEEQVRLLWKTGYTSLYCLQAPEISEFGLNRSVLRNLELIWSQVNL